MSRWPKPGRVALLLATGLLIAGILWIRSDPAQRIALDVAARKTSVTSTSTPRPGSAPAAPDIRVALSDEPVRAARLRIEGRYTVTLPGDSRILHRGTDLPVTTVEVTPQGLRLGTLKFAATRVEIRAEKDPAIWVDDHQYRGRVRFLRADPKRFRAVNVVPVETYLASVVDSEMPRDFGREARAAQAVAARTYAYMSIRDARTTAGETASARDWDLFASVRSQKYLGVRYKDGTGADLAAESADSRAVVAATASWVLTWKGALFRPYYAACCGGHTLRGDVLFPDAAPPHAGVRCPGCRAARWYRWSVELTRSEAATDLIRVARTRGRSFKSIRSIDEVGTTAPDEVPRFLIRGDSGECEVTGHELRQVLASHGVMSPRFTIRPTKTGFQIAGRGHGHGAGLCQWGARGLAAEGHTCREILALYYPGSTLVRAQ